MEKEFYVSRRSVWVGLVIIVAVLISDVIYLCSIIWG